MISIISANFNKANFVASTIQSVIDQTSDQWEFIFVDDGSTDESFLIAQSFAKMDSRIILARTAGREGANVARNIGWRMATKKHVLFLDSDDLLAPDCVRKRLVHADNDSSDFLVFAGGTFTNSIGDRSSEWRPTNSSDHLYDFLRHDLPWHTTSVLWTRTALRDLGGFSEELSRLQDVDLHVRALLRNLIYKVIEGDYVDFYYRVSIERANFDPFELCVRYVSSCSLFSAKVQEEIIRTRAVDKAGRLLNALRGTTFATLYRIYVERASGRLTHEQSQDLRSRLFESKHIQLVFNRVNPLSLEIYELLLKFHLWRVPGFLRFTRILLA